MRRLAAFVVCVLAAGFSAATAGPAAAGVNQHNVKAGAQASSNWSGYGQSGGSGAFHSVAAVWAVPALKTGFNGYSSTWVGIDGLNNGYLVQTGTEADVINHQAYYDAWWEVITPSNQAPEVVYTNFSVQPGDVITGSVAKGSNGKWTMSLVDARTGATAKHTASFSGPGESAEWIQEDTSVNGVVSPAPNWQSVHFRHLKVNGRNPHLAYSQSFDIYDANGTKEDTTSSPTGGNSFVVKWLASGTGTVPGAAANIGRRDDRPYSPH